MIERHEPEKGTWTYSWDGAGMLKEVARPDGVSVKYAYDALGRRVSKRVGEVETRWVWDGDLMLHEVAEGRTVTWCYEPESFALVAQIERGVVHHMVNDQLGAPIASYSVQDVTAGHGAPDAFGAYRVVVNSIASKLPQRWPGQTEDSETGLYYNRFRYYDPKLGTYLSPDPMGFEGGLATYAYVIDSLTWLDPFGLNPCSKARRLRAGKDVNVGSFQEADEVLFTAFPGARKVRGAGPKSSLRMHRQVRAFKLRPGDEAVYHKDFRRNPADPRGSLYGHEELPDRHSHRTTPHINVLTPEGNKATIFIRLGGN
jgi:RHS repeat-associated protein